MWLIKKIGSVAFTAGISTILMILLIISTTLESLYGTPFVQRHIYQTTGFDIYLSLLWINIFCAMILRFPLKKKHISFVITHIGILGLLLGALLTSMYGSEGWLVLYEGDSAHTIKIDDYHLKALYPDHPPLIIGLDKRQYKIPITNGRFDPKEVFCPLVSSKTTIDQYRFAPGEKYVTLSVIRVNEDGPTVEIALAEGGEKLEYTLRSEEGTMIHTNQGDIFLSLIPKERPIPFSLSLQNFRKNDYPGTTNPASFESDVVLTDKNGNAGLDRTISMNKPLDYDGYRIFQSSYIQDSEKGEASVFTVSKKPGTTLIYLSSLSIFLGAFCQFYTRKNGKDQNV